MMGGRHAYRAFARVSALPAPCAYAVLGLSWKMSVPCRCLSPTTAVDGTETEHRKSETGRDCPCMGLRMWLPLSGGEW